MLDIIDLWVCYEGEKEQTWGHQRANGYIKTLEDELQAIKFLDFWEQFIQHNPPEKLWEEWKGIRFEISASPLTCSMQFIPLIQYAQFKIIKTSCDQI